jgi:hypothetical protein
MLRTEYLAGILWLQGYLTPTALLGVSRSGERYDFAFFENESKSKGMPQFGQ